ncbi:MAG: chorismate-binding protein, partial [Bdellovibrionales bacterium]|nr:chorismate-binding protein [Bdellovibrionales bacterium]
MKLRTYFKTSLADTVTPLGMYLRIRDKFPGSILLESTDSHAQEHCMTFIAIEPIAGFQAEGLQVTNWTVEDAATVRNFDHGSEVLSAFAEFTEKFEVLAEPELPKQIANGFFGYAGFNAVQYFEDIAFDSPYDSERCIPDLCYQMYRYVIAVDHFRHRRYIAINTDEPQEAAFDEIQKLEQMLSAGDVLKTRFSLDGTEVSNMTDEQHEAMIVKCKEHIARGDIFQIVPSRRFTQKYQGDDMLVYRVLRSINPSPYLFYFDYGSFRLIGSSPEAELITANGKAM